MCFTRVGAASQQHSLDVVDIKDTAGQEACAAMALLYRVCCLRPRLVMSPEGGSIWQRVLDIKQAACA